MPKKTNNKPLLFFRDSLSKETTIEFHKSEYQHIRARRIEIGESILISNGVDTVAHYELSSISTGKLLEIKTISSKPKKLEIATAIPKGSRLDFLLQKGTELQVSHWHFLNLDHSVREEFNPERYLRITDEALSQSGQFVRPKFEIYPSLGKFLSKQTIRKDTMECVCLNPNGKISFKEWILPSDRTEKTPIPVIGCEAGWSDAEIQVMETYGVPFVTVGEPILRVETAGLLAIAVLQTFLLE